MSSLREKYPLRVPVKVESKSRDLSLNTSKFLVPKDFSMAQFMSVFMIVLFNQFPSGLNLYYTLFNILTIFQQRFINRDVPNGPG